MIVSLKPYAIDGQPPRCAAYGKVRLDESKLCCGGRSYVIHRLVMILEDGVTLTIHVGDDEKQAARDLLAAIGAGGPYVAIGKE